MFIDTAAANERSRQSQPFISSNIVPYTELQTPLLEESFNSHDAPPTYLEATTPGLYYGRSSDDEGAALLNCDEQVNKEGAHTWRNLRQSLRTRWTNWLGIVMLLVFVFAAGIAFTTTARKDKQASVVPISQPSALAAATEVPVLPTSTQSPQLENSEGVIATDNASVPWPSQNTEVAAPSPSPPTKQIFPIRWPSRCGKKYNVKTEEHDFGSPSEVNVKEAMHQLDGPYKRIQGWIHITRAPADQAAGTVQARISYAVSPSIDVDSIKYSLTSDSLTIGDPSTSPGFEGVPAGSACLSMSIVLYMATGITLEALNVESTHLGMQIHSDATFSVINTTSISLTSGTLNAASLDSRETRLRTTSGSISGKYTLSDMFAIDTKTGSVNIDVKPKAAAAGNSGPAVLKANSHSGSMRIDLERKHIPERDYQMYLNTTVGSIDGTFIHGTKTEISSVAGSVSVDILPFKSGTYVSTLSTYTHSGQVNITLHTPFKAKGVPMLALASTHKSVSGGVGLKYPKEWQGHIEGTSLNGELHLQGKDLKLLDKDATPGKNHIEAKKGDGGCQMVFSTVSGGCDVQIGKT